MAHDSINVFLFIRYLLVFIDILGKVQSQVQKSLQTAALSAGRMSSTSPGTYLGLPGSTWVSHRTWTG